jgi:hypothetical protein
VYVEIGTYGERKVSVVLEQDCHRTSKISEPQRLDILTINKYAPLRGVVDSSSKFENRALSGPIRTDYDLRHDVDTESESDHPHDPKERSGRTQSWPGKTLKEMPRRAYCSLPGYRNETFL